MTNAGQQIPLQTNRHPRKSARNNDGPIDNRQERMLDSVSGSKIGTAFRTFDSESGLRGPMAKLRRRTRSLSAQNLVRTGSCIESIQLGIAIAGDSLLAFGLLSPMLGQATTARQDGELIAERLRVGCVFYCTA